MVKNPPVNAGDLGLIPGLGKSGEGNSCLQYSCLGNPMDRGAWSDRVHGVIRVGHNLATTQQQQQQDHVFCLILRTVALSIIT